MSLIFLGFFEISLLETKKVLILTDNLFFSLLRIMEGARLMVINWLSFRWFVGVQPTLLSSLKHWLQILL